MAARHFALEMMRGVATDHMRVGDGTIRAVKESTVLSTTWGTNILAAMRKEAGQPDRSSAPVENSEAGLRAGPKRI